MATAGLNFIGGGDTLGRLHDKSLKITLSLNFRLTAVDCLKSGLTSLRLTLSLNSRLLAVDCMKQVNKSQVKPLIDGLHKTSFG